MTFRPGWFPAISRLLVAFAASLGASVGLAEDKTLSPPIPILSAKATSTQTIAARGTVSPTAPMYGAFEIRSSAVVYILVRGPSLTTLGVTPNSLDAPWLRLFDASGNDLTHTNLSGGGQINGGGGCDSSSSLDRPVIDYYAVVRNSPAHERDSCLATGALPAGVYTFQIQPSIPGVTSYQGLSSSPSTGEILFEATLAPTPAPETNFTKSEKLVGGKWTLGFNIGSSFFSRSYSFNSVIQSTNDPAEYYAVGVDEFGDTVLGGYDVQLAKWVLYDPSSIIDLFYTFSFSDLNHVAGCYYQISPPGSSNLSSCYNMAGIRSPAKAMSVGGGSAFEKDRDSVRAALQSVPGEAAEGGALPGIVKARRQLKQQ
jgi:hypothetical protein